MLAAFVGWQDDRRRLMPEPGAKDVDGVLFAAPHFGLFRAEVGRVTSPEIKP
jgi:hypothetical protein